MLDESNEIDHLKVETNRLLLEYRDTQDKECRDLIFSYNIGLVYMEVNEFLKANSSIPNNKETKDELIQLGSLGLVEAIEKFDFSKGNTLSSYAHNYILNALRNYFSENRLIYLPKDIRISLSKINSAKQALFLHLGHEPTLQDVSSKVGIPVDEIEKILAYDKKIIVDDDALEYIDSNNSESAEEQAKTLIANEIIDDFLFSLSERDRDIFSSRHFHNVPYKTLAMKYQLSIPGVKLIDKSIEERLWKILKG